MKRILLAAVVALTATAAQAQPPAGDAKVGDYYGEKPNTSQATSIAEVPGQLAKADTVATHIRAKVLDVCPKKGCWVQLQVNDSTTAFVKMKDYAFFLPTSIKGKTVVLDGYATYYTPPLDETKHYAKDAKKTKAEIDAITESQKEIRFLASGIEVVE